MPIVTVKTQTETFCIDGHEALNGSCEKLLFII